MNQIEKKILLSEQERKIIHKYISDIIEAVINKDVQPPQSIIQWRNLE